MFCVFCKKAAALPILNQNNLVIECWYAPTPLELDSFLILKLQGPFHKWKAFQEYLAQVSFTICLHTIMLLKILKKENLLVPRTL